MFGNNFLGPISTLTKTSSGLSLSKILGGAGKTLGFVNKALPLYYQVKPMITNAKTVLNMYSAMGNDKNGEKADVKQEKIILNKTENNDVKQKEILKADDNLYKSDSLTFFQ